MNFKLAELKIYRSQILLCVNIWRKIFKIFQHLCLYSFKQIQIWCVTMFRYTSSTQKSLSKHSFYFVNALLMQIFLCYLKERQHSYTITNSGLYHGIIEPLKVTVHIRCLFGKWETKPFFCDFFSDHCTLYCTEAGNCLQRISNFKKISKKFSKEFFSLNRVIINEKNMKPPKVFADLSFHNLGNDVMLCDSYSTRILS